MKLQNTILAISLCIPTICFAEDPVIPAAPTTPAEPAAMTIPVLKSLPKAEMLAKYDSDADGKLSKKERKVSFAAFKKRYSVVYNKQFDTNSDGTVDDAEKKVATDLFMKTFDKNSDGKLDKDEKKIAGVDKTLYISKPKKK